jgi:hypothetical protein
VTNQEIYAALAAPFAPELVKQRVGAGGMTLKWVPARAISDRLNAVLGVTGWDFNLMATDVENVVLATLTIRLPDGTTAYRSDYGYQTGGSGEALKEASSDGLRRTASLLGCASYLWGAEGSSAPQRPVQQSAPAPTQRPQLDPARPLTDDETLALKAAMLFGGGECPTHHKAWVLKPAGVTKTGREYAAFYSCGAGKLPNGTWCNAKPSAEWVASQSTSSSTGNGLEELPF